MILSNDEILYNNENGMEYIQFKRLLRYKNLIHAYALKPLDFRTHFENSPVEAYSRLCERLGIDVNTIVRPHQTHTNIVKAVNGKINENEPDINVGYLENVDGVMSNKSNITLATTNADCILILFYDPVKNVICNVHSGWRGTFKKISKNAISAMKEEYDCEPKDIIACICPSIRVCHFEVEDDVKEECEALFAYTNKLEKIIRKGEIKGGKQKYFVDTVMITKMLLEEEGVIPQNIVDCGICSYCNSSNVHSRRADGIEYGLGSAIIGMK